MFSSSFSSSFAGREKARAGGFSSAFSAAFAGVAGVVKVAYIAPMSAQAALAGGAPWVASGHELKVAGKLLIGPAGKVFSFASEATAARWAENAKGAAIREAQIIAGLPVDQAEAWKARKREKLAMVAYRVAGSAARQKDAAKRAALIAESDYCFLKWS